MESTLGALHLVDDQDRISQLPDAILHYIFSKGHMEAVSVVRTCILSKRWRNLWASMPYLIFCDINWNSCTHSSRENKLDFAEFVDTVLLVRDTSDVQTFDLSWVDLFREQVAHRLATWMKYAVNHNVKELNIEVEIDEELFELPCCVFTCQSLECVSLNFTERYINAPSVVNLTRLRKLMLGRFILNDVSLKVLMSGCPVLEDLFLFRSEIQDPDIFSNSLKKLRILRCWIRGTNIRIFSPSLNVLDFSGNQFEKLDSSWDDLYSSGKNPNILLENLSSLAEANIPVEYCRLEWFHESALHPLSFVNPWKQGLSNNELSELQTFHNLKKLELFGWSILRNFTAVNHFLKRAPNLELLTLVGRRARREDKFSKSFDCSHSKLHVIVKCDGENDRIFELVTAFFNDKCGCFREWSSTTSFP